MNSQLAKLVVLVLSCIGSDVLAGLLPGGAAGGGGGYQYSRPGSGGFGGGGGGGGGGFAGDAGFGGISRTRPSQAYGPPGSQAYSPPGSQAYSPPGSQAYSPPGSQAYSPPGSQTYGPPGSGGDTFGRPSAFGGQPSSYRQPQFGDSGSGGYQDRGVGGLQGGYGYGGRDSERPQPYSFQYEVIDPPSGNDYSQRESSDGNVVQGEYKVLLPDSRTQIVRYTADDVNGYNAEVQYEGQAQYPRAGGYGGGYQGAGRGGGFGGPGGGFGGSGGGFGGDSNQYLPPRNSYRK